VAYYKFPMISIKVYSFGNIAVVANKIVLDESIQRNIGQTGAEKVLITLQEPHDGDLPLSEYIRGDYYTKWFELIGLEVKK